MKRDVVFLGIDEILEIHRDQINRYGGLHGIRDLRLLQSSVAMPRACTVSEHLNIEVY